MHWIRFAIVAVIAIVFQTALAPHLALSGIRPDWVFVLAVFYALLGPWPDACIAAWILGLLMDLGSVNDHVGLCALAYGAVAWLIVQTRDLVFPDHWLSHTVMTLIGALLVQFTLAAYLGWTAPAGAPGLWGKAAWTALYTAFWAPYFHWLLTRIGPVIGLRPPGSARSRLRSAY
jgi:rod shape-determining protein MreD